MRNIFLSRFKYRTIMCLIAICVLMFLCLVRIVIICGNEQMTSAVSNTVTVELDNGRGDILDCNGKKLTGEKEGYTVIFLPCDQAIVRFVQETSGEEREQGLERLRNKKPTSITRQTAINGVGIYSFEASERYVNDLSLEHLIGYTDDTGHGVYGLEKSFDEILYSAENNTVSFAVTAAGDFLPGTEPEVTKASSAGSVYLTIDSDIQKICTEAADFEKGAILVTEVKSGKIRAMVSKPGFDVNDLSAAMENENSPFLNRTLCSYSVGSVFKPLIAAAMLESGIDDFSHECIGYSDILGIRFYCNHRNGHGNLNLKEALSVSCNTYFYNAAAKVKPSVMSNLAVSFGFGSSITLTDYIYADKGVLTNLSELENSKATVANFAIGQGNIALSPLVLCNLYSAIANDGVYYTPTVIEGYIKDGKYSRAESGEKNIVISKATAAVIKEYLINVVNTGTGATAKPTVGGAGGKTATAQTGQYKNGEEILNAWFCGFFPEEDPQYVVVILKEGGTSGGNDCAPIFKKIADQITKLNK